MHNSINQLSDDLILNRSTLDTVAEYNYVIKILLMFRYSVDGLSLC